MRSADAHQVPAGGALAVDRDGFSDGDIAHATRMPVGTVKTRLHRARNKLKKILAPLLREVAA